MIKYRFSIRTRTGSEVGNLLIQGQDEEDAKRKLRQMYMNCEILECAALLPEEKSQSLNFEDIASLITR